MVQTTTRGDLEGKKIYFENHRYCREEDRVQVTYDELIERIEPNMFYNVSSGGTTIGRMGKRDMAALIESLNSILDSLIPLGFEKIIVMRDVKMGEPD